MRALAAGATLAATLAAAAAQAAPSPHADTRAATAAMVKAGAVGVDVLIRKGSSTTTLVAGLADTKTHAPLRATDHFRIGSITKSFVATVVLQLVAEGKLGLSDTLEQRLRGVVPGGDGITIKELLQHTSGLYDYLDDSKVFAPYLRGNLGYVWTPQRLVALAVTHPALFSPGARWSYSNTNYLLLGLIVEAVTKHTLGSELASRIFRPLGLRQTAFEPGRHVAAPAAHGYYQGQDITTLSGSYAWAAGAIVSTAADLDRFYRALFTGKLLPAAQLRAMETTVTTDQGDAYGLGLLRVTTPCGAAWGHNGLVPGYTSFALTSKDGRHAAIVLASTKAFPLPPLLGPAVGNAVALAFCD